MNHLRKDDKDMWLDEIEDKNRKFGELTGTKGMGEINRMARVLREFGKYIVRMEGSHPLKVKILGREHLSDDAKELCVAS